MLKITVKTMDSQSRQFEIPDPTTIKDFKELIASDVNVPAGNQRLIFQGRVLADDATLTQDHDDKVLHLVQRLPVVTTGAPSASTSSTTNASASFPPPGAAAAGGGGFNPAQLSQMIFQQAMSGLGNILTGGSVTGNMVPNPSNPNEQIMNIQIDLGGNDGGPRPPAPTPRSTTSSTNTQPRPNHPPPSYRQMNFSAPRQQLQAVERNLRNLEAVLNQLETQRTVPSASPTGQASSAREEEEGATGEVFASGPDPAERQDEPEPMDTGSAPETPSDQAPGSSNSQDTPTATPGPALTCTNHPSLAELGRYYSRMLQAQRRLEPFVNQMINIFNTDPPYSSTQIPEYRRAARLLTQTLQGQQIMAEIQRLLSMAVIPLGRTPPRTMLLRATSGGPHAHRGIDYSNARRIYQAVQRDIPFMSPRTSMFAPHRGRGGAQQRPPGGPTPGGTVFRQRVIPMGSGGVQMRWRGPPPPTGAASSAPSSGANIAAAAASAAANLISQTTASSSTTGPGGATVFSVQPPTYHVQVNATIQPQISFSVGESPTNSTGATPSQSTTNPPPQQTATPVQTETATNTTTSSAAQTARPMGVLPDIPGLDQSALSGLFQSVAQSVQQRTGGQVGRGAAGIIVMQGTPGRENQMSGDMSNIVGQSVYNAMLNQLSGSTQPTSPGSGMPNVRVIAAGIPNSARAPGATPTSGQRSGPVHPTSSSDSTNSDDFQDARNTTTQSQGQAKPSGPATSSQTSTAPTAADPGPNWRELLLQIRNTANMLRFDLRQRISQFLQGFGLHFAQTTERPRRYLSHLYHTIATEFSCDDILNALLGHPAEIHRLRDAVRNVTTQDYFPATPPPTADQLVQISGDVSEDVRGITTEFFEDARSVPDVDIVESNLSLMRHSVQRFLEITFFSGEGSHDAEIARHLRYCLSMWVRMNESLLRGGRRELVQRIRNFRGLRQGGALQLLSSLGPLIRLQSNADTLVFLLNLFASLQSVSQNQIDQFVLSQAPSVVENEQLPFVDSLDQVPSSRSAPSREDPERPRSPPDSVPRSSAGPTSSPATSSTSNVVSGDSWKKEVPTEWVDTIVADAEAQQNMDPQMPFSDAYIAGMPASKRRKVVS